MAMARPLSKPRHSSSLIVSHRLATAGAVLGPVIDHVPLTLGRRRRQRLTLDDGALRPNDTAARADDAVKSRGRGGLPRLERIAGRTRVGGFLSHASVFSNYRLTNQHPDADSESSGTREPKGSLSWLTGLPGGVLCGIPPVCLGSRWSMPIIAFEPRPQLKRSLRSSLLRSPSSPTSAPIHRCAFIIGPDGTTFATRRVVVSVSVS